MVVVIYMNMVAKKADMGEKRPGTIGNAVMAEGLLRKPVLSSSNLQIVVRIIAEKCPDNTVRPKVISAVAKRLSDIPDTKTLGEIVDEEVRGIKGSGKIC